MALSTTWERPLLDLAYDHEGGHTAVVHDHNHIAEERHLALAHHLCQEMTYTHSRSFYLASQLLAPAERQAVRALYAFCRTTDDIVDNPSGGTDVAIHLRQWRDHALSHHPPQEDLVAVAWADARHRYRIPRRYAEQLIDGVARDMHQSRYHSFDDLATYCYSVASTVGLMSMHIIGFESEAAVPYAIKLGVALQLTNILRDVGEDWRRGRFYLPTDELADFGLTEEDVARGVVDDRWRAFMRFQIERTRRIYEESWAGIALLAPQGRLAIAAAAGFYRAILDDIEAHDYDNFGRRAHVTQWGKVRLLPRLWWQVRRMARE